MELRDPTIEGIALERPRLDPDLRPALVPVPDHVRVVARVAGGRRIVVIPRRTLAALIGSDRLALWRDFDDLWDVIAEAAVRVLRSGRYDRELDARTAAARVVLEPSEFSR